MPVNVILIGAWVMFGLLALTFWISPKGCRFLSLHFLARAHQLEAGHKAYHETIAGANAIVKEENHVR
jgi:hypothetical protein